MEGLADKVVLVTGGSSGIGEACARRLAVEGCAVMVAGRDEAKTKAVAESLLPAGKHGWVTGDVREVGDCRALVAATMDRYGQLDVLVHCAGIWDERPTLDVSEEDWDAVLDTCLKGAFFTMQAALVPMAEAGGGRDRRHRQRLRATTASPAPRPTAPRRPGSSASCARWRTITGPTACASARSRRASSRRRCSPRRSRARPTRRPTRAGRPTDIRSAGSDARRRSPPWSPSWPRDEAGFVSGDSWLVDGGFCA